MAHEDAHAPLEGIAVVGIAGRFPGARDCGEFWDNLQNGRETLTFFSDEELAGAGLSIEMRRARVRSRGVIPDPCLFDASFFGYTPKEAEIMDPQHRVFLETAWEALERAGYDPDRVPGPVGVFGGSGINTYYPHNIATRPDILEPFGIFPTVLLNEKDFLATRVSYRLNLRGPALTVQTACSTSLVAICHACQSLLAFDCDIALAGGVMVTFPQCHSRIHEEGGMISTDGHCRPFDEHASGTLFSDGVGVVALRRVEDAVASGDPILAVIRGFALNNDGADKAGFTAPSVNGQARVIQMAHAFGDISPDTISYVEAHGTATPLGDPIEIAGLTRAFRSGTRATGYCAIGSVKSNIGHLDVAAGVAGFIKVVLALQHRQIPPTINFSAPNPKIDFASSPFYVADTLLDWKAVGGGPRRAGVSSFGIGGTNAHVVLDEAPTPPAADQTPPWQLILLSARTPGSVDRMTARLRDHVAAHPEQSLTDVAHTLQVGRRRFSQRRAVVCRDAADLVTRLAPEGAAAAPILSPSRRNPPIAFMFPGQGSQRINMGKDLYEGEPQYREIVERSAELLEPEIGIDLRAILYPEPGRESWAEGLIVQTRITQPALFVTEYALARLWMSWGIRPAAMIGHSVGEYVAACLAGVFSLEDGLRLIAARGRLIQEQPGGSMLAVMASEAEVRPMLEADVDIAAVNASRLLVASGPPAAIDRLEAALAASQIVARRLHTSHAFHSAMMDPVIAPFTAVLRSVQFGTPRIPYVSNVTARWATAADVQDPGYWAKHLRQAVRFADGVARLLDQPEQVLLEVGPGGTLTSLALQQGVRTPAPVAVPSLPTGRGEPTSDRASMLAALGRLWQAGLDEVDWAAVHGNRARRRVALPTYPFERALYFVEPGDGPLRPAERGVERRAPDHVVDTGGDEAASARAEVADRGRIELAGATVADRLGQVLLSLSGIRPEAINRTATFLELGLDSLFLAQLSRSLQIEFGVPVAFKQLTGDLSSFARLATYLDALVPGMTSQAAPPAPAVAPPTARPAAPDVPVDATALADIRAQLEALNHRVHQLTQALIPPADVEVPLSEAQREIWLASQLGDDASRTYNESYLVHIDGSLNVQALQESLQELVDRHDALRSVVAADGSHQRILGRVRVELPIARASTSGPATTPGASVLDAWVRREVDRVFAPAAEPLFRFRLFQLDHTHAALLLVMHHLVVDGWSWGVLLEELGELYSARVGGTAIAPRQALQYRDYVGAQASPAHRARVAEAEAYWLGALSDRPAEVDLPADRPRPPRKTYRSGHVRRQLGGEAPTALREAARRLNCTVFQLLLASFNAWLARVTGRDDLVVGVPMAGQASAGLRDLAGAERLVGHSVNMLPIRARLDARTAFTALLDDTRQRLVDAREYQDVSLGTLIEKLRWPHDASRTPLVSVSLNLARAFDVKFEGLTTETRLPPKAYSYFDLTVDVIEGHEGFVADCKFNRDLCDEATVERWLSQWARLLDDAIARPETPVSELALLPDHERHTLLVDWNATQREFRRDVTVHELVAEQARQTPEHIAVVADGHQVTYRELDERSTRLARHLLKFGVGPEVLVGVCLERSVDMVVALVGVLKAGGAYVPLDPAYPKDRISYVLDDAKAAVLLTQQSLLPSLDAVSSAVVCLDRDRAAIDALDRSPLPVRSQPDDRAYVIYTSGSTGKPKGVQVEHRAVVNFLSSMQRTPGLTRSDRLLAVTTLSFDIAGLEIFLPLVSGATVCVASSDMVVDGGALDRALGELGITVMQATPATWRLLLGVGWPGKADLTILCGGEPLPEALAAELLPRCRALWNMYGPTETTIWSTCCQITQATDVHIGRPIDNTLIRVVDQYLHPVPIGVTGELLIGGDGLARGYLERPELTAERFVVLPGEGGRFYRTGDLARYRADGNLECLGRLDFQVKVRGFRVELGEIEAALTSAPGIAQAVVVARGDHSGTMILVAYVVPTPGHAVVAADVRQYLRRSLPEYMLPQHIVEIEALPLTPNGKVDRKSLTARPVAGVAARSVVPPRNATEELVAHLFEEVLGLETVGVEDDFFDLGGHSLMAAQLTTRLRAVTGHNIALRNLFEQPTVAGLAQLVDAFSWTNRSDETAEPANAREEFVL